LKHFFEHAGSLVRAAPKEKNMKRTIPLWLGLLAFSLLPALAQSPTAPTGKIHGHVTNPVGTSTTNGTVSLSNDDGHTDKYAFPVDANGDYKGEANPGTYMVVYRAPDTPKDKMVDSFPNVKIVAGQDIVQDVDMSRKEYIDKLDPEQKKQLEELRTKNAAAMQANQVIKVLNADIKTAAQDLKDVDTAAEAARQQLGATAAKADLDAKTLEIKTAKFTEVETIMLKDTGLRPTESVLWAQLGQAQKGLKKYDEATASFKKVLQLEADSKKPNLQAQGAANEGLGEIAARQGKIDDANAAYDAAAKVNPPQAQMYLKNEAVIFFQAAQTNGDAKIIGAQVAAADKAIAASPDPKSPTIAILYYLKGQGLISAPGGVTEDPKTHKLVPPAGAIDAFQTYLALAPTGQFSSDVKGILAGFNTTVDTTYSNKSKKGK
jgi:tetratricopeptide (TPR) repeat protein